MERSVSEATGSTGRRKSGWNDRTLASMPLIRSTETPAISIYAGDSSEIQLEELHETHETPETGLNTDLARSSTGSRPLAGGIVKNWLARRISIVVPAISPTVNPPYETMDSSPADLKLGGLFKYHVIDWLLIVLLIGLEVLCQLVTGHKRYLNASDFVTGELKYPLHGNTIPFEAVPFIALGIPLVFILGHFIYSRNVRDMHHAILGLLTAVALTAVITDSVKDGIGRPRPHFYAACFGSPLATPNYDPVTGNVICSSSVNYMKESYKSFPSGHTSWSFAGLGYLAMYFAGKLRIFDRNGHSWKLFPVILPLLGATFVGVTRIDDYWHHWTDVCAGALIGLITAYYCYRQHFPSLFEDLSHLPYPFNTKATRPLNANDYRTDLECGSA